MAILPSRASTSDLFGTHAFTALLTSPRTFLPKALFPPVEDELLWLASLEVDEPIPEITARVDLGIRAALERWGPTSELTGAFSSAKEIERA